MNVPHGCGRAGKSRQRILPARAQQVAVQNQILGVAQRGFQTCVLGVVSPIAQDHVERHGLGLRCCELLEGFGDDRPDLPHAPALAKRGFINRDHYRLLAGVLHRRHRGHQVVCIMIDAPRERSPSR